MGVNYIIYYYIISGEITAFYLTSFFKKPSPKKG